MNKLARRNRALFIDRDGTINRDCPYCFKPEDLVIYPDTLKIMREYLKKGYLIIIITNQSGIGRKYFTIEQMNRFNNSMLLDLRRNGVPVNAIYYCPHLPEEGCNCRKPKTAMIEQAAQDFNVDMGKSFVIGDRDDMEGVMARKLGIPYRIIVH
ncbi:MAG: HAD-IIIA family hydrolase [Thermoplasmataceae archaeon]